MSPKRVLVAPLNWGLGHATRCIPLIDQLLDLGHLVVLASDGQAGKLLKQEYPDLPYVEIPGYDIQYPIGYKTLFWLKALPRVMRSIKREKVRTQEIIGEFDIDWIISDNRYGVRHTDRYSILITHQLRLPLPWYVQKSVHWKLHRCIRQFHECWIPDMMPPHCLSGRLSNADPGIPINYMGVISRMRPLNIDCLYDLCIILSGPEPHRSILQTRLESKQLDSKYSVAWVLGQPGMPRSRSSNSSRFSHLPTRELNRLICSSRLIISRSGYTSIMDYHRLSKKAILIPTNGQPEQEYLAKYHAKNPAFRVCGSALDNLLELIEELIVQEPNQMPEDNKDMLKRLILKLEKIDSRF